MVPLAGCWNTGPGEKIGVLTKVASHGLFCQTWEAQIVRGGLNTGSGVMGQPFDFTIEQDDMAQTAQAALNKQQTVKIYYHSEANSFCRSESDSHFLDKIVVAEPKDEAAPSLIIPGTQPQATAKDKEESSTTVDKLLKQNQELIELLAKKSPNK